MPDVREVLLFQIDYLAWANQEILRICSALSSEELDRDLGTAYGGILPTLRHMFVAEWDWLVRLQQSMTSPDAETDHDLLYVWPVPAPDLDHLAREWASVWPRFREYVAGLQQDEFDTVFLAMETRISRWKLIQHVVNHATLHRGQVMSILRQMGKRPTNTDLFEYYRLHCASR
jgi:uncharacterized damage-inducible protein DinB